MVMEAKIARVEQVIFELDINFIKKMRRGEIDPHTFSTISVPEGVTKGVPRDIYNGYRTGLASACADVVIQSWQKGEPIIVLIKREKPPFANCWFVMGGAIHAYRSIEEFLIERTEKECGLRPRIESLLGIYRTAAEDGICDTIQTCYVGTVTEAELSSIKIDSAHTEFAFFTKEMFEKENLHWYPRRVGKIALETAKRK